MSNIIAAIDIETTGLAPRHHDIIEIAIQPLDEAFEPNGEIPAFVARIKARRPQNASAKAMEVNGLDLNEGDEYHVVLARLLSWLEKYGIGKIDALGQNVDFDRAFIEANIPELGRLLGHRNLRTRSVSPAPTMTSCVSRRESLPSRSWAWLICARPWASRAARRTAPWTMRWMPQGSIRLCWKNWIWSSSCPSNVLKRSMAQNITGK